jgi:predicted membrane GTPase involved in stress response
MDLATPGVDLRPLFDAVVAYIPPPHGKVDAPLQALVANLDASDYLGRLAIGRIFNGLVTVGDPIAVCKLDGSIRRTTVTKLYTFEGLKRVEATTAAAGDIICLPGISRDDHRCLWGPAFETPQQAVNDLLARIPAGGSLVVIPEGPYVFSQMEPATVGV